MKISNLARVARESEIEALKNVDVPAVDIGEALATQNEAQVTDMQADVIAGDIEVIDATSNILEDTKGTEDAAVASSLAAENIRILGARYGVKTVSFSRESIGSGSAATALRKDALRVRKQIFLAREAVGNRFVSAVGNFVKKIGGQFSITEKRFDAVLAKAKGLGDAQPKEGKTFDNGQVLDNITNEGQLIEGATLKKLGDNLDALSKAQTTTFKMVAHALNGKSQTASLDLGKAFPPAMNKGGEIDMSGGVFAGGQKVVLSGFTGKATGIVGILELFAGVSYRTDVAKKVKKGSEGLPILPASEVLARVTELKAFSERSQKELQHLAEVWEDAMAGSTGYNSPLYILSGLAGVATAGATVLGPAAVAAGAMITVLFSVLGEYDEARVNNNNREDLGGMSAAQADKAIGNFNSAMYMAVGYLDEVWYSLTTNLLHYYDWCLKHQAKGAANESITEDYADSGNAGGDDMLVVDDVTADSAPGASSGLVDTMVQADLNTVQDMSGAVDAAPGVTEDEAAQVEETLNAVAERRNLRRVKIAREGRSEKAIRANTLAATKMFITGLKAQKARK